MKPWMAALLLALAGPALADTVIKCVDPAGRVTWTNRACGENERSSVITVDPVAADSSGLRDWSRRNPARPTSTAATRAQPAPRYINPVDCGNARRAYEFELGWKFRKKEQLAYLRKEVCRVCGECP